MIQKFNNFLNEQEYDKLSDILKNKIKWCYEGVTSIDNDDKIWYADLLQESYVTNTLFEKLKNLLNKDLSLIRVYANGQTFGLDGHWHQDSLPNHNEYTFLYYYTNHDDPSIIGETYFKRDNNYSCELPIPNSAVLFNGDVWHKGMGPKKEFKGLRITIAFKLKINGDLKDNKTLI